MKSLPSVPRSKGCITCVSRKKRCDGRRPTCRSCEGRKQTCRGYRREEFVFLSDRFQVPGVGVSRHKKKTSPLVPSNPAPQTLTDLDTNSCLELHQTPFTDRSHLHVPFFLSGFATYCLVNRPHFMADLFQSYFSLLSSPASANAIAGHSLSTPVVLAVDALSQGHFGKANNDAVSMQESFRKYGMAQKSMSVKLAELKLGDSGFQRISEDDWQHLAFFCLVMTFWELRIFPSSQNWQKHIRALTSAIVLRGTDHNYSETNLRLIATSRVLISLQELSSRRPGSLSGHEWQKNSPVRLAWVVETEAQVCRNRNSNPTSEYELYTSLDSLFPEVAAAVDIMAQYDRFVDDLLQATSKQHLEFNQTLLNLYHAAETTLHQTEALQHWWESTECKVPLATWLLCHPDETTDIGLGSHFLSVVNRESFTILDTVLSFPSSREYNAASLYWMMSMALRLLLSDMLGLMIPLKPHDTPKNYKQKIEDHRVQLMTCAQKVLRSIPFAELKENRSISPFFVATPFQMTVATLERESRILRGRGCEPSILQECENMKNLAISYMNWAMRHKIPINLDMDLHAERLKHLVY